MAHLTNFSFEFFNEIFTEDASLLLLYHGAKKSKMTKNSNQGGGGPALIGRFCSTHITYENYVRCLRTTNVKIGFACAFGPTYVVTYVFSPFLPSTWPRTLVDCDFPQELQVVGDREAHSCLASGICDDAKSYDDRQTKACPLVSTGL